MEGLALVLRRTAGTATGDVGDEDIAVSGHAGRIARRRASGDIRWRDLYPAAAVRMAPRRLKTAPREFVFAWVTFVEPALILSSRFVSAKRAWPASTVSLICATRSGNVRAVRFDQVTQW